jgi:hypothetical protein
VVGRRIAVGDVEVGDAVHAAGLEEVDEVAGEERLEEHGRVAVADREELGGEARGARAGELRGRESGEASAELGLVGGANKAKLVLDEAVRSMRMLIVQELKRGPRERKA